MVDTDDKIIGNSTPAISDQAKAKRELQHKRRREQQYLRNLLDIRLKMLKVINNQNFMDALDKVLYSLGVKQALPIDKDRDPLALLEQRCKTALRLKVHQMKALVVSALDVQFDARIVAQSKESWQLFLQRNSEAEK
jgi:hypothetical protein